MLVKSPHPGASARSHADHGRTGPAGARWADAAEREGASRLPRARQVRDATRALLVAHGALDTTRRPCGTPLPTPHAFALIRLYAEGPMTITELAAHLRIDRSNVSRLCARMEQRGEVERQPHPTDGRARVVCLTERGARIAAGVEDASARHFLAITSGMSDAEVEAVLTGLRLLVDAMRWEEDEA